MTRQTITNALKKDYNMRNSRYEAFPYYFNKQDNKYFYGLSAHLKQKDISYIGHKVKQGDTLDTLALYYYNNPTYFWVIADFNRIRDPYEELKIDSLIKIPTFTKISFDI